MNHGIQPQAATGAGRTDSSLLAEYANQGSDPAFAALVDRHIGFVHAAAVRLVRDSQLAEDVVQAVFLAMARDASRLVKHPALCGWLHLTTRNVASNMVRREVRRKVREQEMASMESTHSPSTSVPDPRWIDAEAHLDAAIGELNTPDQHALLLRFFEGKSARETALQLGISEDAAQKRASRALERLRQVLNRKGVSISTGALLAGLACQPLQAAPAGLAASIASTTANLLLADHATVSTLSQLLFKMTTLQKIAATAACAVLLGVGVQHGFHVSKDRRELAAIRLSRLDGLREMESLHNELQSAKAALALLREENQRLAQNGAEVHALRNELAQLRRNRPAQATGSREGEAARDEQEIQAWASRVNRLKEWAQSNASHAIPEFGLLTASDWWTAVKDRPLESTNDFRRAMSAVREISQRKFASQINEALRTFQKVSGGAMPADLAQLAPHFSSPPDPAMLREWTVVPASSFGTLGFSGETAITQRKAVDEVLDVRFAIGQNGHGSSDFFPADAGAELDRINQAYLKEHNGEWPADVSGLLAYAKTPKEIELLKMYIERRELGR